MTSEPALVRAQLELFTQTLHHKLAIHEAAMAMVDRKLATKLNVLHLLPPGENGMSTLLRELLDPNGSHGQGDRFLLRFLEMIGLPRPSTPRAASVATEHYTRHGPAKGRWIDLLIRYDGYAIGIENKLWAGDQQNQVRDYLEDVRRQGPDGAWLIYLTPDGRFPSEWSLSNEDAGSAGGSLRLLAYVSRETAQRDIVTWLADCNHICEAPKTREFLTDFEEHLLRRFPRKGVCSATRSGS